MKTPLNSVLLQALRDPAQVLPWRTSAWSELVQQARMTGLLGRVAHRVSHAATQAQVLLPTGPAAHFESSARLWRAQQGEIERETSFLRAALKDLGAPVVVLKGAAYVLAGLPAAEGRLFSDIDIMVPKAAIARAESLLQLHGWMGTHADAYDQRYYREWMHELPPMEHMHRRTVLDVHHTILPETSRLRPDAASLFQHAVPLRQHPGLYVLSPPDMVLHSMTHLFMNDELSHALRDLSDLDTLLRHFAGGPTFWRDLTAHAEQHQLSRILHYGLHFAVQLLGTPVPAAVQDALLLARPGPLLAPWMDALWLRAMAPVPQARSSVARRLALFALFIRGHWMRMPPALLVRHLTVKAMHKHKDRPAPEQTAAI